MERISRVLLLRLYQISFTSNRIEQQLDWIGVSSQQHACAAPAHRIDPVLHKAEGQAHAFSYQYDQDLPEILKAQTRQIDP